MMAVEPGMCHEAVEALRAQGITAVNGVFVGGCFARGIGSSFRASGHAHPQAEGLSAGWVCIRSAKRVLTPTGRPTRLLLHEAAHILAPRAGHGTRAFVRALESVGIKTDSYSRAGRNRATKVKR